MTVNLDESFDAVTTAGIAAVESLQAFAAALERLADAAQYARKTPEDAADLAHVPIMVKDLMESHTNNLLRVAHTISAWATADE